MSFTESNTVEQMILDAATTLGSGTGSSLVSEGPPAGWGGTLGEEFKPSHWTYAAPTALPRQPGEVMVEPWVRDALMALNPEIAEQPDRADEVIYALRAILLSVQGDGLVRANENFMAWLRGEKTMPFGPNGEHVAVRLVDFTQPAKNRLKVTNQWTYQTRDKFAGEYSVLGTIWEALSPDPCLGAYAIDYKWLTQVYESVKPVSGNGKLLWHRLGAKTIELINENVHVEAVNDDLDALVLDADILDGILGDANPAKKAKEVEIKLIARLRKHAGNPKFKDLGERLEKIKERHEQGLLNSLEFLKAILEIAKEVVEAENQIDPEEEQDRALAALTELFNEVKDQNTHVIVERLVADIDAIVRQIRFDGWQTTSAGEREVQKALRQALRKFQLHTDQELFDKAYGYIRQYY